MKTAVRWAPRGARPRGEIFLYLSGILGLASVTFIIIYSDNSETRLVGDRGESQLLIRPRRRPRYNTPRDAHTT